MSVSVEAHKMYVAEQFGANDRFINGLIKRLVEARITYLQKPMVASRCLNHSMAAGHIVGHHFFAEDIDACLQKSDGYFGMGPERRCYDDNFELFFLRQFVPILVFAGLIPSGGDELLTGKGTVKRIDIADGFDVDELFMTGVE